MQTCEVCGKETNEQVSYLELETWEFDFLKNNQKDFYAICFDCFDKHTNHFIDQDVNNDTRKKRVLAIDEDVQAEIEAILSEEV